MSDDRAIIVFGANITDITTKLREAQLATKEAVEGMNASIQSVKETFMGLSELFVAIAGVEMFAHMVEETAELASHLEILSQKTGMAVEDLSRLRYAADLSHISADLLDTGMARLARSMQDAAKGGASPAADAFRAMGIAVTDAEGHLRPMRDVFLDVAQKFSAYEDGAAKSALAMNLFGRSGAELVPLLNKGADGIRDLGAEQDKLNATMTEQQTQVAVAYENAMKRMDTGVRGLKQSIALALMPSLTALAEAFTTSGATSELFDSAMSVVSNAIREVGIVAVAVKFLIQETYETFRLVFREIGTLLGGIGAAFMSFVHGDFKGAAAMAKATFSDMGAEVTASSDRMKEHADLAASSMRALWTIKPPPETDPGEAKRKKAAPTVATPDPVDAKAIWAERAATATEGKDALLQIEMEFWQQQMDTIDRSTTEGKKLYHDYLMARLAALAKYNADVKKASEVDGQTARDAALAQLDIEKQSIEERRALHQLDAQRTQTLLIANADAAYEIQRAELESELDLADGDLVKQASIQAKLTALSRSHAKDVGGIHKTTTTEIASDWQKAFSTITDTVKTSFDGVIRGTQSLTDAMHNLFRNLTLSFIAGKLEELKVHSATELAKRGITTATVVHTIAMHTLQAIQSVALTAWSALKNIAAYAAEAAAAAWAALSAVPFVGPFLGPAVAATTLAGVLALGGNLSSAAGGFDIPAGLNPMTQLHAREMVLPADLADKIRGMPGGGAQEIHIHAMDHQSFRDFARRNPEAFGDGVAAAIGAKHTGLTKALKRV